MVRSRIQWRVLDSDDDDALFTTGWLPDTLVLRWALVDALRVEGVRHDRSECYEAAENAEVHDGYVTEDEAGDLVEVTSEGIYEGTGERVESFYPATIAVLRKHRQE